MADDNRSLLDKYLVGPAEVGGTLAAGLGAQAVNGLGRLQGQDTDVHAPELGKAGQGTLRDIAPAYYALKNGPVGKAANWVSDQYGKSVDQYSDLASRYLGPQAGGEVAALGAVAPMAIPGPGGKEAAVDEALAPAAEGAIDRAVLPDGSTKDTLEREYVAAQRDKQPAFTLSTAPATSVGHPEAGLIGYHPDAIVTDAHDPATGDHIGRLVAEPSADGTMLQGRTADVDEGQRGKGVGTAMLRSGVDHAHGAGMDWGSDVKLSPGQVATYMKLQEQGYPIEFNPTSTVHNDQYLTSGDGRPVIRIPQPTHPDGADPSETSFPGAASGWIKSQAGEAGMQSEPLSGMPTQVNIPGVGPTTAGPNPLIRGLAAQYMADHGLTRPPVTDFVKADPARGAQIAQAYDAAPHAPDDPAVAKSYQALINETKAQYGYIKQTGFTPEFIPSGSADPYAASPRLATEDINRNNHMWVFPTSSGFGTDAAAPAGHPMLADSGETIGGQPATNNDIFRVVHDYFGHAKEGVGFRADGEENAWRQHAQMYSDEARPAMTAETRGQNSWVNYGPNAQGNATANGAQTVYAPQKATILPDQFNHPEDPYERAAAAVQSNGGVTMHPGTGQINPPAGYAVSTYPGREAILPHAPEAGDLKAYVSSQGDLFDQDPGAHLGVWEHPPGTGQHYMDVSHVENDLPTALDLARQHQQLGIFDLGSGQTIMTDGSQPAPPSTMAAGGVARYAEGGEAGTVLGGLGEMMAQYAPEAAEAAGAVAPEAQPLADHVATYGGVTYDPLSGNTHVTGTVTDPYPERTVTTDHAPDPSEIHDFLMQNQDILGNPETPGNVLHVTSDENGFHYMRVGEHEPEMPKGEDEPDQDMVSKYLENAKLGPRAPVVGGMQDEYDKSFTAHTPASWTPGEQTVANPRRNAFPGVYQDPRATVAAATEKVAPEDPLLQQLFGVSRSDLSDLATQRQGNELGSLPGLPPNPTGSAAAFDVAVPKNAQRLQDVLSEASKSPSLFTGMNGWYSMDPLYERFRQIYGDEDAPAKYAHFNTLMSMASPGSSVDQEIARGSAAHWLANEGRFADFQKYGGGMEGEAYGDRPADMEGIPGHVYHSTAQAGPMADYVRTGKVQLNSAKVPVYMGASGVPETGFQTDLPTGDAHFARAVGLPDTRGDRTLKGQPVVPGSSASTSEMGVIGPWFRNQVASPLGMEASPAQAVLWGAMSPHTGVKSAIGAPKLELLSQQIGKLSQRLGISPESARDLVITGKAGAFAAGGRVR
jgi:hypothetical protein